jgi:hypothetical protein
LSIMDEHHINLYAHHINLYENDLEHILKKQIYTRCFTKINGPFDLDSNNLPELLLLWKMR